MANLLVHYGEGWEADGAVIKNNDKQLSALFTLHRPLTGPTKNWSIRIVSNTEDIGCNVFVFLTDKCLFAY